MSRILRLAVLPLFLLTFSSIAKAVCESRFTNTVNHGGFCALESRAEQYCYTAEGAPDEVLLEIYHVVTETNTGWTEWTGHPTGYGSWLEDWYSAIVWPRTCYCNSANYWVGHPITSVTIWDTNETGPMWCNDDCQH